MTNSESTLQKLRENYLPLLPNILKRLNRIGFDKGENTSAIKDVKELQGLFPKTFGQPIVTVNEKGARTPKPLKVGVVLSGGQASGGHNVIAGLFDALKLLHEDCQLIGFLGGPSGIINGKSKVITHEELALYRNQGGFDLIGSGRTKIETEEQLKAAHIHCHSLGLDGLVVIGGDDSNTNAAVLAEYFLSQKHPLKVIGVPKTIDGDLKNKYVASSFGFDTACKTYSESIGSIERDALSAKKYYHFIKLMGRSASHIALECALSTQPNFVLISEEVAASKKTLAQITKEIADVIVRRSEKGKDYGVILIPEGLIEFIPEVGALIAELNHLVATVTAGHVTDIINKLTEPSLKCFQSLPEAIQKQLLFDRDPHGNVQVSLIETEKLLLETVAKELGIRRKNNGYEGKFNGVQHFFGYEGRACFPSNFDAHYCYALGYTAALLIDEGLTGYMACVSNLHKSATDWKIGGIPITMLMNIEKRGGKLKPVIKKALVDLQGKPFQYLQKEREKWAIDDHYRFPGPIQFFGDRALTDEITTTLRLETS